MFDNLINPALKGTYHGWSRMWFLIGEIANVLIRSENTVYCKQCGQQYNSYDDYKDGDKKSIQGHDICALIKHIPTRLNHGRWVIICAYGSDFDLHEFWYVRNCPKIEIDGICDWCIRRMLADGTIIDCGRVCTIDGDYDDRIEKILTDTRFKNASLEQVLEEIQKALPAKFAWVKNAIQQDV